MDSTVSTETVTKAIVNKNTVKIALDEYNELVRKASRPIVNQLTVNRLTDQQVAQQNVVYGTLLMVLGFGAGFGGLLIRAYGKTNLK